MPRRIHVLELGSGRGTAEKTILLGAGGADCELAARHARSIGRGIEEHGA